MLSIPFPRKNSNHRSSPLTRRLRPILNPIHRPQITLRKPGTKRKNHPSPRPILVRLTYRQHIQRRLGDAVGKLEISLVSCSHKRLEHITYHNHLLVLVGVIQPHANRSRARGDVDYARRCGRFGQQGRESFEDEGWAGGVCGECCGQAFGEGLWAFACYAGVVDEGVDASGRTIR